MIKRIKELMNTKQKKRWMAVLLAMIVLVGSIYCSGLDFSVRAQNKEVDVKAEDLTVTFTFASPYVVDGLDPSEDFSQGVSAEVLDKLFVLEGFEYIDASIVSEAAIQLEVNRDAIDTTLIESISLTLNDGWNLPGVFVFQEDGICRTGISLKNESFHKGSESGEALAENYEIKIGICQNLENQVYTDEGSTTTLYGEQDAVYMISVIPSDHGSASGGSAILAKSGEQCEFTFTPDLYYEIDGIQINGADGSGAAQDNGDGSYTVFYAYDELKKLEANGADYRLQAQYQRLRNSIKGEVAIEPNQTDIYLGAEYSCSVQTEINNPEAVLGWSCVSGEAMYEGADLAESGQAVTGEATAAAVLQLNEKAQDGDRFRVRLQIADEETGVVTKESVELAVSVPQLEEEDYQYLDASGEAVTPVSGWYDRPVEMKPAAGRGYDKIEIQGSPGLYDSYSFEQSVSEKDSCMIRLVSMDGEQVRMKSAWKQIVLNIDTEAPVIHSIESSLKEGQWTNQRVNVIVHAEDAAQNSGVDSVWYSTDAGHANPRKAVKKDGQEHMFELKTDKEDGPAPVYYIWAVDRVGHESDTHTVSINAEYEKPVIRSVSNPTAADRWMNTSQNLVVEVTDAAVSSGVRCLKYWRKNEGEQAAKEITAAGVSGDSLFYSVPVGSTTDTNEYQFCVYDYAGNCSDVTQTAVFIDQVPPEIVSIDFRTPETADDPAQTWQPLKYTLFGHFYKKTVQVHVNVRKTKGLSDIEEIQLLYDKDGQSVVITRAAVKLTSQGAGSDQQLYKAVFELDPAALPYQYDNIRIHVVDKAGNEQTRYAVSGDKPDDVLNNLLIEQTPPEISLPLDQVQGKGIFREKNGKLWAAAPVSVQVVVRDDGSGLYRYSGSINGEKVVQKHYEGENEKRIHDEVTVSTDMNSLAGSVVQPVDLFEYNVSMSAVDNSGNESTVSGSVYVDTAAPRIQSVHTTAENWTKEKAVVIGIQADDQGSGMQKVVYSNSEKDFTMLYETELNELLQNGGLYSAVYDKEKKEYTITVEEEQDQTYYIWAVDNVGNVSESKTQSVRIDRTAPTVDDLTFHNVNKNLKYGNFSNQPVILELSVSDGVVSSQIQSVSIWDGNQKIAEPVQEVQKNKEYRCQINPSKQYHNLYIQVEDHAGNVTRLPVNECSSSDLRRSNKLLLEQSAPEITIDISGEAIEISQKTWFAKDVDFHIELTDAKTELESGLNSTIIKLNDVTLEAVSYEEQDKAASRAEFSISTNRVSQPQDGAYRLEVFTADNAGNTKTAEKMIYVDRDTPQIDGVRILDPNNNNTEIDPADNYLPFGNYYNRNVSIEVSYSDRTPSSGIKQEHIKLYAGEKVVIPSRVEAEQDNAGMFKAYFNLNLPYDEKDLQVEIIDNTGHSIGKRPISQLNEGIKHDGLMLENQKPKIVVTVPEADYVQSGTNETENWYASDLAFMIAVEDQGSGIRSLQAKINDEQLLDQYMNTSSITGDIQEKAEAVHTIERILNTSQTAAQSDGSYKLWVEVIDNAGNTEEIEKTVYVDYNTPQIKSVRILDPDNNNTEIDPANNYRPFGNYYNKNVSVEVRYSDETPSSGVRQEQVRLYAGTEMLTPDRMEEETDSSKEVKAYFNLRLPYEEEELKVEVTDNTGHSTDRQPISQYNESIQHNGLMLEEHGPEVEVTVPEADYVRSNNDGEEAWYQSDLTFTMGVEDSESGIRSVKAELNKAIPVDQTENTRLLQENTYTANTGIQEAVRNEDGSYVLKVTAVDNANNQTEVSKVVYTDTDRPRVTAYRFEPAGNSEGQGVPVVTDAYGYYFSEPTRAIVTAEDAAPSSGLWKIEYRLVNVNGEVTSGVEDCANNQIAFDIPAGFKGKIYTTAIDHVGNAGEEQQMEGVIQENAQQHAASSEVRLTKPETENKDTQGLDLYNTAVPVTLYVKDTFSGIRTVDWRVEAAGDPEDNQYGHLDINNEGSLSGDEGWGILTSDQNIRTALEKTIVVSNNSNAVTVTLDFTDRAGHRSSTSMVFSIDTTAPQIQVSYTNNEDDAEHQGYFKEARVAEVTVTERNFHEEDVRITVTNSENVMPVYSEWMQGSGTGNEDDITHTMRITYEADGDYTFDIGYTDLAGNQTTAIDYGSSVTPAEFTIDRTLPSIALAYDNMSASGQNNYYYQAARTATITIEEHNFDESRAIVTITSRDNNGADLGNAPSVGSWSSNGDTRKANIAFDAQDANYSIAVQYTDMAGNVAAAIEEQKFCVDQNDPVITITGVEDRHAYNKEIIQPVVTFSDVNLDAGQTQITLTGASQGVIKELKGQDVQEAALRTFTFDNLEEDDIYTLTVSATDGALRTNNDELRFSVNRHGSTYELSEETKTMNHSYTNAPVDVVVHEVNVDPLAQDSLLVTLSKDNMSSELRENQNYTLKKEGQDGEWSEYIYTISKDNFKDDGNYAVRLYSVDGANNISQNDMEDENKKKEINFHVDKTSPNIGILNLKDGETYPEDSMEGVISVSDNTFVKKIQILLNDKEVESFDTKEIKEKADKNENYQLPIANSNQSQSVHVIAVDAAGNSSEIQVRDFYVTTNLWIRFINNKFAFYGTIAGIVLILAAGVTIVFLKKKRADNGQAG